MFYFFYDNIWLAKTLHLYIVKKRMTLCFRTVAKVSESDMAYAAAQKVHEFLTGLGLIECP